MQKKSPSIIEYDNPNEGTLFAIQVDNIISFNDGDVCNAYCTDILLSSNENKYPICVDIGVDKGWWSSFCLHASPGCHVYAYEPNPLSFKNLKDHFAEEPRITLIPKAISNSDTSILLTLGGEQSHSRNVAGNQDMNTEVVEATTLAPLFEKHQRIDLIKIDTEGHEWTIFKGLSHFLPNINAIIFEFTPYWYGDTRDECFTRSLDMLTTVYTNYNYVYVLSRRGVPSLMRLHTLEDVEDFVYLNLYEHVQVDILACRIPLFEPAVSAAAAPNPA